MKVFISSTYKDLIDYRAAAIRAVEGTNYQASKMEVFGARPDEPLDACLKEVEESELFIGIYAHRYGYVPAGFEISITEMEYVHAKKLGKPIYAFVVDEENQPWLPKFMEGEPGASKLKAFKQRIQTDHVCAFFTTSDDLGMKVANALSHYVANHDSNRQSQIENRKSPAGSTLPHQPYFFGRTKELDIIKSALSPDSRTWGALIDGPGGIGKTALAIKAAHGAPAELFERKIFITAKVRELTAEGEAKLTDFTRPTYLAMLDELGKELGADGLEKLAPDERPNELRLALAGKKALIIFDNLETLPEDERTRLFQFLSRLPEGNKAIVTSRRRTDVDARIVRLDRLARDEALEIYRSISPESNDVSRTLNSLAGAERANKDYDSAERDYREGLRISKKNNNQEHIATRLGNLAALALDREQWAEAESLTREALTLAEKVGRQELIASDCHHLAKALLKQNKNLDEALPLSRRAVEIYTRLRHPDLQSAQELLEEIEKAIH